MTIFADKEDINITTMKRIILVILIVTGCTTAFALQTTLAREQTPPALQVKVLKLQNGMTVWLNEDHSQPKVYGAVVVRAGAKDCPDTGIAHYFEHIMFKGTDRIGTVDYEAERPWLDSISAQYDLLSQTTDETLRTAIQKHINELSLKAADYAIPNEFSRLIAKYGGTGLNAATSPDMTVYYNTFMPQYISQWCWLNSERLISPVFRGFQGELENVYEEKNRSADFFGGAMDKVLKAVFKEQPYAFPVLGSTENLKNPRLSDMAAFYKKYYVASNMCLTLCGDFTPSDALTALLEETFGRVQTGPVPQRASSPLPDITAGERTQIKLPIPIISAEALVFKGATAFDADAPALRLARLLLSNGKAGMIDSLANEHAVTMAGMEGIEALSDAGIEALYIIPRIPFGKMKKAEDACRAQLQRVIEGDFTEQQLEIQKRQWLMEAERELETIDTRGGKMIDVYASGYDWQQYLNLLEACRRVTKEDVMRVARKYYGANYLTLQKKYGIGKKETVRQPDYIPIKPKNAGSKSEFAQWMEQLPSSNQPISTVDLDKDVERTAINDHATLFSSKNPINDIFTFTLRYYKGSRSQPLACVLADYLSSIGTDSLKKQQLETAWMAIGTAMEVECGDERFTFKLTGRDDQLEPSLRLLAHFLSHAQADKEALKEIKQAEKVNKKAFGKQKDDVLMPMIEYVRYGRQSDYLHQPSLKEVKALTCDDLLRLFQEVRQSDCDIVYAGRLTPDRIVSLAKDILPLEQCSQPHESTHRQMQPVDEPTVYFYHVSKSRQNFVCSYEQLPPQSTWQGRSTAALWAHYLGGGMSGVLFQNVREYRSLAYSTHGQLLEPEYARHADAPLAFITITGTQADKTLQAVGAIDTLIRQMPMKTENLNAARQELLSNIQNGYPTFRTIGYYVANQLLRGYTEDPSRQVARLLPLTTQNDVEHFQQQHVATNQRAWIVIGDRKQTDLDALKRYGKVVELHKEDIYR